MYYSDHPPPHFHAEYGEHMARVEIESEQVVSGSLPTPQMRMVRRWTSLHRDELLENWERRERKEPLSTIEPL